MKGGALIAAIVLASGTLSLGAPESVTGFTPEVYTPDHVFECGEDEPPSGSYLDPVNMTRVVYDCETGLLTPHEGVESNCLGQELAGKYVPAFGFCIPYNDVSPSSFQVNVFIAYTGLGNLPDFWYSRKVGTTGELAPKCDEVPGNGIGDCPIVPLGLTAVCQATTHPSAAVNYCNVLYAHSSPGCGTWYGYVETFSGNVGEDTRRSTLTSC